MKKIPEHYKEALRPYFSDKILNYPYIIIWPFLFTVLGGFSGLTLKRLIFLNESIPNKLVPRFLRLLAHEFRHLEQQKATWLILWLIKYGYWYMKNRLKGLNHNDSYYAIPAEKDAYDFQEQITLRPL